MLEKALVSSETRVSYLLGMVRIWYQTPEPLLTASKPGSFCQLGGGNHRGSPRPGAPDLPDPDFYFPLLLISYLIISLLQVRSLEASLSAFSTQNG